MNIQALMKQAQVMQKEMLSAKDEIDKTIFIGNSSLVEVQVAGNKKVLNVKISNDGSLEKEDIELLEDMIVVALNDAFTKIDKITDEKMGKYTKSMPGLF